MARLHRCVITLGLVATGTGAADPVALREEARPGQTAQVTVTLKAAGLYRPQPTPGAGGGPDPKPLDQKVEARLGFDERVLALGPDGAASRTARRVNEASSAINGEVRPLAARLRPEVALLVAERRDGAIAVHSPGGPLTRSELELVQGAGDPLALAALLPGKPVAVGARWTVGPDAARSLSGYDALAANRLEATLEALDDATARLRLAGEVRGACLGGEGAITFQGSATFDRRAARVDHLEVERTESRKPGPVEAGLDMKSTLTVARRAIETPPELADAVLDKLPSKPEPHLESLLFRAPDGKYSLLHDRDWHTFWDDSRHTVLKRLDRGELVAQCNLAVGPNAGRGRHQDPAQFRDDIRRALGKRFIRILEEGEVEGPGDGGFRYKVAVQGLQDDGDILWLYYLVAGPDGDQVLVTFTLWHAEAKRFADQDLRLIGSLQWR
jgi:hypothetical protein